MSRAENQAADHKDDQADDADHKEHEGIQAFEVDDPHRLVDVICELYEDSGRTAWEIHDLVNFYDDGSPVRDTDGNVLPEVTLAFIEQVIADYFP